MQTFPEAGWDKPALAVMAALSKAVHCVISAIHNNYADILNQLGTSGKTDKKHNKNKNLIYYFVD